MTCIVFILLPYDTNKISYLLNVQIEKLQIRFIMKNLKKILPVLILFNFSISYSQSIIIENNFEGGNIEVLSVDSVNNIISVTPEYKNNDTRAAHFLFKVKGLNISTSLKIRLYTDQTYYAPDMIRYSIDLISWESTPAVHFSGYNEYSLIMSSDSIYFAMGFPYLYSDVINLIDSLQSHPHTEVSDLTVSEGGRPVKLIKLTDPAIDDSSKFLVWIIARQHAFESHSNHVVEGLIKYILSENYKARRFREQAIFYVIPVMDVDNAFDGGTGKDQLPVDFNRDWNSPSYWNAVIAAKELMEQTASSNSFEFFIDSHNPWPGNTSPLQSLFFYTSYKSGPLSYNIDFYRDLFEDKSGYSIKREQIYSTIGQTSMSYVDSIYAPGLNVSMETGWIKRPDDSLWTIERYLQNGEHLGEAMSDYINNLPLAGDLIIDNRDSNHVDIIGDWISSTHIEGYFGENYIHDNNEFKGSKSVSYLLNMPEAGYYEVFLRWTSDPVRANNVPVKIYHSDGVTDRIINQKKKGAGWVSMGIYYFENDPQQKIVISNGNTDEYVIADAIRLSRRKSNIIGIEPNEHAPLPVDFKLYQNFPNPFNPFTVISYRLPVSGNVMIQVYDLLGREVTTLVDEYKSAGSYKVEFDAAELPSGIYFYKLHVTYNGMQTGEFIETKKLLLLK
jgi:hypothetical protein